MKFIGIDTSCYTTSVAMVNEDGELLAERHKLLSVADGERGLRQSEAFFKHINNLPALYQEVIKDQDLSELQAIGVSSQPRSNGSSYMPVFYAGLRAAELLAATVGVPLYQTDHQQGHIAAALHGTDLQDAEFLAVHLSGGTTEILRVNRMRDGFKTTIMAGSSDINAGQLIDRIGVAMGLPFPSGKYMDEMAMQYTGEPLILPISANASVCSFSGTETAALRELQNDVDKRALAYGVLSAVNRTLTKMLGSVAYYAGIGQILVTGGVSSSKYLRENLPALLEKRGMRLNLHFAPPSLSADNAVGVALLTRQKHLMKE